jgi:transposase
MIHHSEDYKLLAVKYYLKNKNKNNIRNTCKLFDCKYQSLSRWIRRYNTNGNIRRKTRVNKNIKITKNIEKYVKDYTKQYSTTTLLELSKLVKKKYKVSLSDSSIHNIFKANKITRKRLRNKYYPEIKQGQEANDLSEFYHKLHTYKYNKTICLDETSIYLNMTLSYGRSKSGSRVIKKTHKYPYKRYNLLCAISANKVIGWILYKDLKGGVKTDNIINFYNQFINNKYKNHLIIMDNAVIHRSIRIRQHIENTNNHLLYSVPYNPQTNAIEEFFSQLKHYIKKESPNTYEEIDKVIKSILKSKIKKLHLTNYLKHSFKIYN